MTFSDSTPLAVFTVDPEHTRALARDLDRASQHTDIPAPQLPSSSTLAHFSQALLAAFDNVAARSRTLHADIAHLSRAGYALANATVATDEAAAAEFARADAASADVKAGA